jgi:glycosyltransferase involved in cell wall biosynthesis
MRILHIVAGAEKGGAETFCLDAIKALDDIGLEQVLITRSHEDRIEALEKRSIRYHEMSFNRLFKPLQRWRIKSIIAAEKPDLIHSWMNRGASFTPIQEDIPVLGWFGGYYNLKNFTSCDFYMGVTRDIVCHIGEKSGQPENAYLGHTFGTLEKTSSISKSDYGIPKDAPVVLLLSRMHWKKGVDLLLDAARDFPGVHFLLAGSGPDLDKYKALARDYGIADRAHFPGWCDNRAALLEKADVCCLPSRYEPFGTVIPESWYAGVPLVATRADGARQYVTDGEDGLLVEIDDRDGLALALEEALNNKTLRKRLIKGGKASYDALFSRDVVTRELIASYEDMIRRYQEK